MLTSRAVVWPDTNRTRVVKVVKPSDSFFNFFTPPTPPTTEQLEAGEVDEGVLQELDERLELDYQIGEDLKERVRLTLSTLYSFGRTLLTHDLFLPSVRLDRSSPGPSTTSRARRSSTTALTM